jgi:hypothetical protein
MILQEFFIICCIKSVKIAEDIQARAPSDQLQCQFRLSYTEHIAQRINKFDCRVKDVPEKIILRCA